MKIAVGIIGIVLSFVSFMQSGLLTVASSVAEKQGVMQAGAVGMLMAFLMFLGGAFSFGVPKVALVMFIVNFLLSFVAKDQFPDAAFWGYVSLVLGGLLAKFGEPSKKTNDTNGEK
ncbi:hypothetical protein QQG91_13800 [Marivivens sp. LCG002]|uniref:hypothetical protein n=1 Tax=Marivivens sp. LCG002 TaxID=3051171 RepID=UPI0025554869|nr:hypothetical protein [Marivivens sp. LCG002]WIV50718.1 hypothetical protein QQG91_13800 [Marivivens sp. LCG002]